MGLTELETDAEDLRLRAGLDELTRTGVVRPLSDDPGELRFFMDCDLASLVENQLFECVDPRAFSEASRKAYEARTARSGVRLTSPRDSAWCSTAFFMLHEAELAGTITLQNRYLGSALVSVSSLYVLPEYRGKKIAYHTLSLARKTLAAFGAGGLSVSTCWTWQSAVRFYLALRMWVESWPDALVFVWRDPRSSWSAEVGEHTARFDVLYDGQCEFSIGARRRGDRLELEPPLVASSPATAALAAQALQTFAVVLAVNAWPLIRSDQAWAERRRSSDRGAPEGLAYKLEMFEALERRAGLTLKTPRIPGILYRDHDELD